MCLCGDSATDETFAPGQLHPFLVSIASNAHEYSEVPHSVHKNSHQTQLITPFIGKPDTRKCFGRIVNHHYVIIQQLLVVLGLVEY